MTGIQQKVLLCELKERISAKGTSYVLGWLGKASVVGFWKETDDGERILQVYAQTPPERKDGGR